MQDKSKKENIWISLIVNIGIPVIVLSYLEDWLIAGGVIAEDSVKPIWFFCGALCFPVIYGVWDLIARKKWSLFAIIGVVNVLLTGTIGIYHLPREWIIIKETGIPALLGLVVLISAYTKKPVSKVLVYNELLLDTKKLDAIILEKNAQKDFIKSMRLSTFMIAGSFFLSAVIQFFLAAWIFTEGASEKEFNEQVGKMTWVAYAVVMLPCMAIMIAAMFKIFGDLKKITGLDVDNMLSEELKSKNA